MNKFSPKHLLSIALSFIFIFSVFATPVSGQTSTTFSVMPALNELKVDPGHTGEFTITIVNRGPESVPFQVYTRNFLADGIDGKITFGDDDSSSYAAGDWLLPSTDSILLAPGGKEEITIAVNVPGNAEPGGHYASILFEQVIPRGVAGKDSQVQVATRMTALVYFTVSGDIIGAGQILGAKDGEKCSAVVCGLDVASFFDRGPVPFSFIFNNTGNIHVRPKGTITITQYGRQVGKVAVDDRAVLPNSQRRFVTTWDRSLLIGPYEAKLNLVYGSKDYQLSATASFWAFPWQIVLGVATVLLLIAGIFLSRKYFKVKRLKHGR